MYSDHFRMSGVYWALTALSLLPGQPISKFMAEDDLVAWMMTCKKPDGSFGHNEHHDGCLLATLSAVQIMVLLGRSSDLDADAIGACVSRTFPPLTAAHTAGKQPCFSANVYIYSPFSDALRPVIPDLMPALSTASSPDKAMPRADCASLQQPDGSFAGDSWGEVDTRFVYAALHCCALLGQLAALKVPAAVEYVLACQNWDGGFGVVPGAESHTGQVFCCVGALAIAGCLDRIDADELGRWYDARSTDRRCHAP